MLIAFTIFFRLFTTVALINAMVVAGVVHSGLRPAATSPELAAYVASGGSLFDICGNSGVPENAWVQKCEVCQLAGAAILPRNCHGVPLVLSDQTRVLSFVSKRLLHTRPLDPTRLTRAPPHA